jgi:3-dehydroquinate dehydratase/shikimate dehydrogenase
MTHLCAPLTAADAAVMNRQLDAAVAGGATMIEYRLDLLAEPAAGLPRRSEKLPAIATCRAANEGGSWRGSEAERRRYLFTAAETLRAEWIDFEFAAASAELPPNWETLRRRVILSHHDFAATPADPTTILEKMATLRPGKLKIAAAARSITDNLRLLRLLADAPAPSDRIVLGMGEAGVISRLLAKKFGAFLTFAAIESGAESAPGQPTLKDFRELYGWNRIGPATKLYGVIGSPVAHSKSPLLHNRCFAALGEDRLYAFMPVEPTYEAFAEWVDGLRGFLDGRGCSVTIPHKENALRYARERGGRVDPLAERIGAVNTLAIDHAGLPKATNTDCLAAVEAVCAATGKDRAALRGKRVLVLGAGGAARALVVGFAESGCAVAVSNRSDEKARRLTAEFGIRFVPWEDRGRERPDVLINATAAGMTPKPDETPFPGEGLAANTLVFDTVYNPRQTRLLREAAAAGCPTVGGVEMFLRQAAGQFALWTGRAPPMELMRETMG